MHPLELKFRKFIKKHELITNRDSVLLTVSGGIDSMVMLRLFTRLKDKMNLKLSIVHVNHKLRGKESNEDANFVENKSAEYGIPYYCESVDVKSYIQKNKLSKQAGARTLRYERFEKIRLKTKSNSVATAHHADDNVETVLLNIIRGTGIRGLGGIPIRRESGRIIRPLLFAKRSEIEEYAKLNNVEFRTDSSNSLCDYKRNELRHKILPILRNRNKNVDEKLNIMAFLMTDVNEKLKKLINKKADKLISTKKQDIEINLEKLKLETEFIQDEIFIEVLNRLNVEPSDKKIEGIKKLLLLPVGKIIQLSGEYSAYRERGTIIFRKARVQKKEKKYVQLGKTYEFNGLKFSISRPQPLPNKLFSTKFEEYVDAGKISGKIILRPWKPGDWFIPLGMNTKKKLSDFLIDEKTPRFLKTLIYVLETNGNIIWVCGKRIDNRYKITDKTKKVLKLTYQQIN